MNRTFTAQLFFAVAAFVSVTPSLAFSQLNVVVDEDNHFVMQSDGFDVLGIQLESASGSLVPAEISNTGPFDLSLMKNSMVVMFGSLGKTVRVEGEVTLPTQWNPDGQQDVGFRWGSPTEEGVGAVAGHVPQFVTPQSSSTLGPTTVVEDSDEDSDITIGLEPSGVPSIDVVDESTPIFSGGDVASDIPVIFSTSDNSTDGESDITTTGGNTSSEPAFVLPGYIGLDVEADPPLIFLAWNPGFDTLTVSSTDALLVPTDASTPGLSVISQSESSATFAFDDQLPDGAYELPLSWTGSELSDISLAISPADESVLLEVLGESTARLAPEPSSMTLLLVPCLGLPLLRRKSR